MYLRYTWSFIENHFCICIRMFEKWKIVGCCCAPGHPGWFHLSKMILCFQNKNYPDYFFVSSHVLSQNSHLFLFQHWCFIRKKIISVVRLFRFGLNWLTCSLQIYHLPPGETVSFYFYGLIKFDMTECSRSLKNSATGCSCSTGHKGVLLHNFFLFCFVGAATWLPATRARSGSRGRRHREGWMQSDGINRRG